MKKTTRRILISIIAAGSITAVLVLWGYSSGLWSKTTRRPCHASEMTSMKDFTITDFKSTHAPVSGETNKYLILGNISVTPLANHSPDLNAFLGRWEGYGYGPPVKKDWKFVLVIKSITPTGGYAVLWGGTNLQYPSLIKEIRFKVVSEPSLSIAWEDSDGTRKKTYMLAYDRATGLLRGSIKKFTHDPGNPVELSRSRTFFVYKNYSRYLAEKRIYPRSYRSEFLRNLYGRGYLLYLPEGYETNPRRKWPLLIFLHGSGDRGNNLFLLAKASPFMMIREKGPLPFIIAAPLLRADAVTFSEGYLDMAFKEILADYRVDMKRIYVTGLSMGGDATYRFALKRPDTFAAIAPLAAYLSPMQSMASLKSLPVWAIHGAEDTIIPLTLGQQPVEALKHAGNNVRFSVLAGHDHDVWTDTYSDPKFYDWLLKHHRP
jgi:predicted esterase